MKREARCKIANSAPGSWIQQVFALNCWLIDILTSDPSFFSLLVIFCPRVMFFVPCISSTLFHLSAWRLQSLSLYLAPHTRRWVFIRSKLLFSSEPGSYTLKWHYILIFVDRCSSIHFLISSFSRVLPKGHLSTFISSQSHAFSAYHSTRIMGTIIRFMKFVKPYALLNWVFFSGIISPYSVKQILESF